MSKIFLNLLITASAVMLTLSVSAQATVSLSFSSQELKKEINDGKIQFSIENSIQNAEQLQEHFTPYKNSLSLESLNCEGAVCDATISGFNAQTGPLAVRWLSLTGAQEINFTDKALRLDELVELIRTLE